MYTLTHRKGEYDHVTIGHFTRDDLIIKIERLFNLAYQYYVTEWSDEDDFEGQVNADEWLNENQTIRP